MKVTELKQIIENIITSEVKKTIMEEATGKKEVYHIKCEGIPLATFESEEEANDALPNYKDTHKDGELIIEKGVYENHDDMMDKLDEMNDQLEETNDMENTQPMEGNEFSGALKAAKDAGEDTFTVDGKEYDVEECWSKQMEEEEMKPCSECGGGYMEEEEDEYNDDNSDDKFEVLLRGKKKNSEEMSEEKECCPKCGKEVCEGMKSILPNILFLNNGGSFEDLNSDDKSLIFSLAETEDGLPNMLAKAIRLQNDTNFYYNEPIVFPDTTLENRSKSTKVKKIVKKADNIMKVYPNPAKDYFIVEYNIIDKFDHATIEITDMLGHKIQEIVLNSSKGQKIINTTTFTKGIYNCCVKNNGKNIGQSNIIIK